MIRLPAVRPCGSCPYRRDVPSGVWSEDEYEKLPGYDRPTGEQPTSVFMCHQQNERVCAGWAGCHDLDESLAMRIALLSDRITDEQFDAILSYESRIPLFASGAEAAAHGLSRIQEPPEAARRAIEKIQRKRGRNAETDRRV